MLHCTSWHHPQLIIDQYLDDTEMMGLMNKVHHVPMVDVFANCMEQLHEEGLMKVDMDTTCGGVGLLGHWVKGELVTVFGDIVLATNWDGQ